MVDHKTRTDFQKIAIKVLNAKNGDNWDVNLDGKVR